MDERDVLRKWRDLFSGNDASAEVLAQAETLLDGLSGESPLHLRLASELEELKQGPKAPKKNALPAASQHKDSGWFSFARKELMDVFRVWTSRIDGATCLRVDGLDNANWLLRRLSDFFVFKTSEPMRDVSDSADCTFRVADNSRLSGQQFENLLARISEVTLIVEPPQPAWQPAT